MSKVVRSVKNVTKGYSAVQIKVRNATSNDPWGPVGSDMADIAQMTFNSSQDFYEIMDMLDKRLNDKGKNWRHVLKSLKVLDYCLHEGSELVVTWAKKNIYIIKTLREFTYIDEDGRDVGQNIRVSAKELTSLLLDEERLRAERSDRKSWKSRVQGIDDGYGNDIPSGSPSRAKPPRDRPRRNNNDESEDLEYKLAMEASKNQFEEDERKRRTSHAPDDTDDDLAKAMKLSAEEAEAERRRKEEANAQDDLLFDPAPVESQPAQQPQATGWNQGYQQQGAVDWYGNLMDQGQQQPQNTGFLNNAYAQQQQPQNQFQNQPTGFGYNNPYGQNGFDPNQNQGFQQQQQQPQFQQPNQTAFNPWSQQQQQQQQPQEAAQPSGSNNPWGSNANNNQDNVRPQPTGSNNPFASGFNRATSVPLTQRPPTLATLAETQAATTFSTPPPTTFSTPPPQPTQQQQQQPQPSYSFQATDNHPPKDANPHHAQLNALLASNPGLDTFGNEGQLRIPAQHTAPGTFVNSAGAGLNRLTADKTANNPYYQNQTFTGAPGGAFGGGQQRPLQTGPAGVGFGAGSNAFTGGPGAGGAPGGGFTPGASNPFGARSRQQAAQQGGGSLIDL